MASDPRTQAQQRADRIAAFREELATLELELGSVLTDEQRTRIAAHQDGVLTDLSRRFDVDAVAATRRVSWGMRVAFLLGGAALIASLVLFLHRVWGGLPLPVQAAILVTAPLLLLAASEGAVRRRVRPYYTSILALAAGVAFFIELNALGAVLNLTPSPHALLAWAAFALLMAFASGFRLLFAAGLVLLCAYTGALWTASTGAVWSAFLERARCLVPAAALAYAVSSTWRRRDPHAFSAVGRACGAALVLLAQLFESLAGDPCCGPLSPSAVAALFQAVGLGLAAGVVWHGIRLGQGSLVNLGSAAFVAFLYARLHAWWWSWMPKYLFFLLVGLIALGLVLVFRRLRTGLVQHTAP